MISGSPWLASYSLPKSDEEDEARKMKLDSPILVTGSAGFVGSVLVRTLKHRGFKRVVGVDISASPLASIQADYGDTTAIPRTALSGATIVHLGGVSTNGAAKLDPVAAVEVNCAKTMKLAQFCAEEGVSQFIFASSEWVYGDPDNDNLLAEDSQLADVLTNTSLYAQTKLATEGFLNASGFFRNLTILRFGIVYGPRLTASSAPETILADCQANRPVEVGSAASARRFIFIDDLVAGIISSMGFPGRETFNLPGRELLTLEDIYSAASRLTGNAPGIVSNPAASTSIRNLSGEKARRLLGWEARLDFEDCLKTIRHN